MNSKLREALENSNGLLEELTLFGEQFESAQEQIKENKAALGAPSEPVGNNAKMREALENITLHFCKNCPNNGPDGCELSEAEGRFEFLCHKLKQARAALAEPRRNCDRFVDELDAQIEFLNDVWLISVTKDTMLERDKFENWTEEMKSRYANWLFAKAKGVAK